MTNSKVETTSRASALKAAIRQVRARYDSLDRGASAAIRRSRSADEVALEGTYWRIGADLAREQKHLSHVVLLFPLAPQTHREGFSFGRYLRTQVGEAASAALRFRRLLDCRDRDELDHRLRGLLKLASRDRAPVDWGTLGVDILWFFAESHDVRRRWAQDFYAPSSRGATSSTASTNVEMTQNTELKEAR